MSNYGFQTARTAMDPTAILKVLKCEIWALEKWDKPNFFLRFQSTLFKPSRTDRSVGGTLACWADHWYSVTLGVISLKYELLWMRKNELNWIELNGIECTYEIPNYMHSG